MSGYSQAAFTAFRIRADGIFLHQRSPAFVQNAYTGLKGLLGRYTTMPPQAQQQQQPQQEHAHQRGHQHSHQ